MRYSFIDSGNQRKFEKFGTHTIIRPCAQALWAPSLPHWEGAAAQFSRKEGLSWEGKLPASWVIEHGGIKFKLVPTDFGHLGIFPEHILLWSSAARLVTKGASVLNLFAYSGGATLALAAAGGEVCHVDASQGMVRWARENAALNGLEGAPIRWITDDVTKFLVREIKRGRKYDGILLDPPSFGRGTSGEVFKIERDLPHLLRLCSDLLSDTPLFFICSSHTNGITPMVMSHLISEVLPIEYAKGVESGELFLAGSGTRSLPTGVFARWSRG